MRIVRPRSVAALLLLVGPTLSAAPITACTTEGSTLAHGVEQDLEAQLPTDLVIHCPPELDAVDDLEAIDGTTYTCTATSPALAGDLTVETTVTAAGRATFTRVTDGSGDLGELAGFGTADDLGDGVR